MSQQLPHFNELFVQEDKKQDKEYNLDSNLLAEAKEPAEQFDRKIVGFDSIDDLFSSLGQPKLKEASSKHKEEVIGQQRSRPITEQQAMKNSASKLPNITINYSQPSARDSSLNHNMGLPTKWIETKAFKKKIIQYQERIVKVPIEKQVIEYYEIQHIIDHEPEQRQVEVVYQKIQEVEQNPHVLTAKKSPIEEKPVQEVIKQSSPSLLQRNKSEPPLTNHHKSIKFQNPNRLKHLSPQLKKSAHYLQPPSNLRFVTTDSYDYDQRRRQLNQIDSKMQYLKQLQAQLLKK